MKGFVRILEAIIASILLIASVSYFFIPQVKQSSWDDIVLGVQARESITALKKGGSLDAFVRSNDNDGITAAIKKTMPPNIDFSVEINGIPNHIIRIACLCDESQKNDLEDKILIPTTFLYKGREIEIRIQRIQNVNEMPLNTNILFVFGYRNFNSGSAALDNFLGKGGTIYMFADLTQGQISDGFMNTRFGLSWSGDSGSDTGEFFDTATPSRPSYKIAKYYESLRNEDPASAVFNLFSHNQGGNQINRIRVESNRTIVASHGSNKISFVKVNDFVKGKGRTVWFANYDYNSGNPNVQQTNNLTKAAVMWASGEKYRLDTVAKNPAPTFSEARYLSVLDGDPYEISLIFWKIFY